ncbi:LysR substrate-binding domain-containing protein [Janthinobacterium sp. NFX145]|uniref:LysR substrate-binding domain-containing protein n=1 Tax=Janthinobacterium sp. NFX145 TaxID=3415602 RepID=UPI003CC620AD
MRRSPSCSRPSPDCCRPTLGGLFAWEFAKDGQELKVRMEGQMIYNNMAVQLHSALDGLGVACMAEDVVLPYVPNGRLVRVLDDLSQRNR